MNETEKSTEQKDVLAEQAGSDAPRIEGVDAEDRSFHTSTVEANRAIDQGLGAGAREINAERDPNEDEVNSSVLTQGELDARADMSRDNHQTPRGNDAVRDTDDNLPG